VLSVWPWISSFMTARAASSCRTRISVAARATKEGAEFVDAHGVARMKYKELAAPCAGAKRDLFLQSEAVQIALVVVDIHLPVRHRNPAKVIPAPDLISARPQILPRPRIERV
jgi:hypothetical protein